MSEWDFDYGNNNNNLNSNFGFSSFDINQTNKSPSLLGANTSLTDGLTYSNNGNNSLLSGLNFSGSGAGGTTNSFLKSLLGDKNNVGWGGTALNLLQSGLGFYLGQKQLNQAEDALNENKRQFNLNYNAQKKLINDQLAWQYQARKDRNANYDGVLTQVA